jgi:glycosyltransferase involved in cell wall biosynthesis
VVDTLVIVPTYNECENVPILVDMLLNLPVNLGVVVVDDNSPDGTGAIADQLAQEYPDRVYVIHRKGKLGLGTAYIAGFRKALDPASVGGHIERIMTMDADFSHHPRYIPAMVQASKHGADLVIGSRYVPGGGTPDFPFKRRLLSWGANAIAKTMLGLHAHDVTAGFRCYRRHVLESLPLDRIFSSGYSFLIELMYLVQRSGFTIDEVPIVFLDRTRGASKISRREVTRALYTVARLSARRVLGRDARYLNRQASV